jgi:hypothetical protein
MGLESLKFYLIGIVLSVVIVTGGLYVLGAFYSSSPSLDPSGKINEFDLHFNATTNVTSGINGMSNSINTASTGSTGILGWLNAIIQSVFGGVKTLFTSFSFVGVMGNYVAYEFGIPPVMMGLILLIITIIIIFAIWSIATGRM